MADRIRILVPAIDWAQPVGGVRKLYRHVDVLNSNGIDALVMHQQKGFRCTWFENNTVVSSVNEIWPPRATDIVMVPEILAWQFVTLAPGIPKIVFNQNPYQTFGWRTEEHNVFPYNQTDFRAAIAVSEDSRAYLQHIAPEMKLFRVRYSIDPRLFYFDPVKKKQIAFMPRKKEKDAAQVLAILRYRGVLNGYDVVQIKDKTEAETARILRETSIFLSFSSQEGWGLPPMEAIACGCVTIGYDGRGGREYLKEPYATPIESEDIPEFAGAIERAIGELERNPAGVLERTARASQFVHTNYSIAEEEKDIMTNWRQIFELLGMSAIARER